MSQWYAEARHLWQENERRDGGHRCGRLTTPEPTWTPVDRPPRPDDPDRCTTPAAYYADIRPLPGHPFGPRVAVCPAHAAELRTELNQEELVALVQTTRIVVADPDDVPRPTRRRRR